MSALSLRLHAASFAYRDDRPLLIDADLHLVPGWYGLVGANGAGKSTLLKLLAGELAPGLARRQPAACEVHRLDQRVDAPDAGVFDFANAWDRTASRWRSRLALEPEQFERWTSLSPGERRRWQLAAALWRGADVLLLDEPDDHLDGEARALLVAALRDFAGIGVLVSHDRALLDAVTQRTLRLREGRVEVVEGPISQAMAVWEAEARGAQEALDAASRARRAANQRLQAARETLAASSGSRSFRHVGTHDHDARSDARKYRAATAEASHAKGLARSRRAAEAALDALGEAERPDDLGRPVVVAGERPRRSRIVAWTRRRLEVPGRLLASEVSVEVAHGDRVWLRGANGAGKSTLLAALVAEAGLPAERVLLLPQELSAEEVAQTLERLRALPTEARGRVLQIVAALGVDPPTLLASASPSPSPGEARKLALALGLAGPVWWVVLDEPDNHLDLPSRQRLEAALAGYTGALTVVTHDAQLGRALTTTTWTLEAGRLVVASTA